MSSKKVGSGSVKQSAHGHKDIVPVDASQNLRAATPLANQMDRFSKSCFEARNVAAGAWLFRKMVSEGKTIWFGISGAGIVGGLGGYVIELIKRGFVDVICSTGAQVYHDLHFAYGLPVKQGCPRADDDDLHKQGITRIYDIYIGATDTLLAQDKVIKKFARQYKPRGDFSSADFNYALGMFVAEDSAHPERSFVATAAKHQVPVFFDSNANHSIAMNLAGLYLAGKKLEISSNLDILQSAAICYARSFNGNGYVELGGGGPKNFIQQTGPTISQILGIEFEGGECGLQITTATEKDGGLSGCTFGEAVTWDKYPDAHSQDLIQIFGEYSVIFPLIAGYVLEVENNRKHQGLYPKIPSMLRELKKAARQ